MLDLQRFLNNPFDDRSVSLADLLAFSTDHLSRMIANNGDGSLTTRISATSDALSIVENSAIDDQNKLGLRKARVKAKDTFREGLPAQVAKVVAGVEAFYGTDSPEVTECVPQGRTVFSTCRDDQLETHLSALVAGIEAHVADLGAPLLASAEALLTVWQTVYAATESSTGAKTTTEEAKRNARETLQLALFQNLLTLAQKFPRQPEKLALYMRQDLIEGPSIEEEELVAQPTA